MKTDFHVFVLMGGSWPAQAAKFHHQKYGFTLILDSIICRLSCIADSSHFEANKRRAEVSFDSAPLCKNAGQKVGSCPKL